MIFRCFVLEAILASRGGGVNARAFAPAGTGGAAASRQR
ncbi:hypothetical protein PATSB16_02870 [Pandoraea thiooxydans]|nr:hypothetical protein PATSB16_02870 [Pandoraea thiooxydans]